MTETLALFDLLQEPLDSVRYRERNALDQLLDQRGRLVVLLGAGTLGQRALPLLRELGCSVVAFSDNNPAVWGRNIEGIPVLSPEQAAARHGTNALFIVTIWNDHHWYMETYTHLVQHGCTSVSTYSPLFWRFPDRFLQLYLLNELPHKLYADRSAVLKAEELWADEASLNCYRANIRWRALGDARGLPGRPDENTYFPHDLFRLNEKDFVLDCGAFDGDTIRDLLAKCLSNPSAIDAVEADAISFSRLQTFAGTIESELRERVHLHQCAVGATRGTVRFEGSGSLTSKASDTGCFVEQIPIDELFADARLTFIKMDIEGAEFDALKGAENVIKRDHPILAICVYHTQSDIWGIPLLVHEMVPEYKLYLRAYEGDGFQTVMYAVPLERVLRN